MLEQKKRKMHSLEVGGGGLYDIKIKEVRKCI